MSLFGLTENMISTPERAMINVIMAQNEVMTTITVNNDSVDLGTVNGNDVAKLPKYLLTNPWNEDTVTMAKKNSIDV